MADLSYLLAMLRIGLTGGIGSGKSTVAHHFEALGIPVIDADVIAHQLVDKGSSELAAIVDHFGEQILNADGSLDRGKLRQLVFAERSERQVLEDILHPRIREEMLRQAAGLDCPYCILSIPLLVESGWTNILDRVLVVDAPYDLQIQRASARDGATRESIEAIIKSQVDRETRLAVADDVLSNDRDLETLLAQVEALHRKYLTLARDKRGH